MIILMARQKRGEENGIGGPKEKFGKPFVEI
jgi:hypothetical protein